MRAVLVGLLFVALSAPLPVPDSAAGERDAAVEFFKMREKGIKQFAAKGLWKAAVAARDDALYRQCAGLSSRILVWDPDHKGAREHLGWRKVKGEWKLDETAAKAVVSKNTRKRGESPDEYWKRVAAWEKKHLRPVEQQVAKRYVKAGADAERRKFSLQADRLYHRAIAADAHSTIARVRLGRVPLDGLWVPAALHEAYMEVRAVKGAPREKAWETTLGVRLKGSQTKHIRVVSSSHLDETTYQARAGELAYLRTAEYLGIDPATERIAAEPMRFCLMEEDLWPFWIRAHIRSGETFEKELTYGFRGNTREGWYASKRRKRNDMYDMADYVAHQTAHIFLYRAYGTWRAPWVYEAIAQEVAALAVPSADARCIGDSTSRYGNDDTGLRWAGSPKWRLLVRQLVQSSDDIALRGLVDIDIGRMNLEEAVKSWSMLLWLRERDQKATLAYIAAATSNADHVELLDQHFGTTPEELDEEWRAYVLRNY